MKTLGFIFRSSPHGSSCGREGLDAVLAASAYCEDIQVFFIGDGVLQLVSGQQPQQILSRDYIATFKMFDLYDIEQVYVCEQALKERGLTEADLLIDVTICPRADIMQKAHQVQRLLTF
ncbi:TPA: sulfurtransferase complex subunit TusC [Photobacterium damselae]|uniref:sulfurtransferase complex subunit TusC n=1 Tax=Photobacterium damselae TaxID=38293 RepID=UPI0015A3A11E|nr:sulfurtransferase complex subunit TusC [Photobacterium damselae]NVO62563.1 sulfurtransferase complex subunit TusC [Photobacterium damselae subsp. damselae]USR77093.1 sulfurtransferase complex subunit TusC [Photobacterium damselae]